MRRIEQKELNELVRLHGEWLQDKSKGKRLVLQEHDLRGSDLRGSNLRWSNLSGSDLSGSDLSGSDLRGSNLRGSNLSGIDLSGSNLSQCYGATYAQIAWSGHGVCGRTLLGLMIDGTPKFFCGCFAGTAEELQEYIDTGEEKYKRSRQRVFDFVRGCLEEEKNNA